MLAQLISGRFKALNHFQQDIASKNKKISQNNFLFLNYCNFLCDIFSWQTFAYSPNNNSAVEKLVQQATKGFNIVGLSNKNDLDNYLFNQSESNNAIGIEFQDELAVSNFMSSFMYYNSICIKKHMLTQITNKNYNFRIQIRFQSNCTMLFE